MHTAPFSRLHRHANNEARGPHEPFFKPAANPRSQPLTHTPRYGLVFRIQESDALYATNHSERSVRRVDDIKP